MPLDIHLSKNEEKAELIEPEMFFPEDLHRAVFINEKKITGRYKQLNRLHDYYSDIFYLGNQVIELKNELVELEKITTYDPLKKFSKSLIYLCEKALINGYNIYCFCD